MNNSDIVIVIAINNNKQPSRTNQPYINHHQKCSHESVAWKFAIKSLKNIHESLQKDGSFDLSFYKIV